jgi:hypothetical protein
MLDYNVIFMHIDVNLSRYYYWWNSMLYVFGFIENIALFSISFFSAVDHPFWHEKVFHVWAVFQQVCNLLCNLVCNLVCNLLCLIVCNAF